MIFCEKIYFSGGLFFLLVLYSSVAPFFFNCNVISVCVFLGISISPLGQSLSLFLTLPRANVLPHFLSCLTCISGFPQSTYPTHRFLSYLPWMYGVFGAFLPFLLHFQLFYGRDTVRVLWVNAKFYGCVLFRSTFLAIRSGNANIKLVCPDVFFLVVYVFCGVIAVFAKFILCFLHIVLCFLLGIFGDNFRVRFV